MADKKLIGSIDRYVEQLLKQAASGRTRISEDGAAAQQAVSFADRVALLNSVTRYVEARKRVAGEEDGDDERPPTIELLRDKLNSRTAARRGR